MDNGCRRLRAGSRGHFCRDDKDVVVPQKLQIIWPAHCLSSWYGRILLRSWDKTFDMKLNYCKYNTLEVLFKFKKSKWRSPWHILRHLWLFGTKNFFFSEKKTSILTAFVTRGFVLKLYWQQVQSVPLATEPGIEDTATKFEQEYVRCVRNEVECVCSAPNCCDRQ